VSGQDLPVKPAEMLWSMMEFNRYRNVLSSKRQWIVLTIETIRLLLRLLHNDEAIARVVCHRWNRQQASPKNLTGHHEDVMPCADEFVIHETLRQVKGMNVDSDSLFNFTADFRSIEVGNTSPTLWTDLTSNKRIVLETNHFGLLSQCATVNLSEWLKVLSITRTPRRDGGICHVPLFCRKVSFVDILQPTRHFPHGIKFMWIPSVNTPKCSLENAIKLIKPEQKCYWSAEEGCAYAGNENPSDKLYLSFMDDRKEYMEKYGSSNCIAALMQDKLNFIRAD